MTQVLAAVSVVLFAVVILGFINEKTVKITDEIALMLFSIVVAAVILCLKRSGIYDFNRELGIFFQSFDLNSYLVEGVLCFMLFAGAAHIRAESLKRDAKLITSLALASTLISAVVYGVIFYGISVVLHIGLTLPMCLLLGSIVAPTDPIAATSILRKFGLPKRTGLVIEAESLFNDGVGVALFVCFSGMVTQTSGSGFFAVMGRELLGAVAVGLVLSFLSFALFKRTQDEIRRIAVSLFAVTAAYSICEVLSFSGAIAAVVCGIYFATAMQRLDGDFSKYYAFWSVVDSLLNSVLYVIIGCFFAYVLEMPFVILLTVASIIINLIARAAGVGSAVLWNRPLPDGFRPSGFITLFTWGGLRGGLCLALALSTVDLLPEAAFHAVVGSAYGIVFFTTVVQGLSMKRVYAKISQPARTGACDEEK